MSATVTRTARGSKVTMRLRPLLFFLFSMPAALVAAAGCATLFPKDTAVYVAVREPAKLRDLGSHPVFKNVRAPGLQEVAGKFLEKLLESGSAKRWKEETGMEISDLLSKFTGGMGGALYDIQFSTTKFEFAFAVDFNGDDGLATRLAGALCTLTAEKLKAEASTEHDEDEPVECAEEGESDEAQEEGDEACDDTECIPAEDDEETRGRLTALLAEHDESTFDEQGIKVHVWTGKADKPEEKSEAFEIAWCVRDGLWLVASGAQELRDLLARAAASDQSQSFAANPEWQRVVEQACQPDAMVAANLRALLKQPLEQAKSPSETAIARVLGAGKLSMAMLSLRAGDDEVDTDMFLTWDDLPPLAAIFKKQGDPSAHKFLPPDVLSVNASAVDLPHALRGTLDVLEAAMPGGRDTVQRALGTFGRRTGLDVMGKVFPAMGAGYWQATKVFISAADAEKQELSEEDDELLEAGLLKNFDISSLRAQGAVAGIAVQDERIVAESVKATFEAFWPGATKEREYMGSTIREFHHPDWSGAWLAWTIKDSWLLVSAGRHELLESVIARMNRPDDDHVFTLREVKEGFASLPGGEIYLSYVDFDRVAEELFSLIALLFQLIGSDFPSETAEEMLVNDASFPVHSFSKVWLDDRGVTYRTRLRAKTAAD